MTIAEGEDFVTRHWPTEIRVGADRRSLTVGFDGGEQVEIAAELLRVESPSAEVQGHSAACKQVVAGKGGVTIASIEPVGNYAIRIGFDDGHATGLYTWRYLYKLGTEGDRLMAAYLSELEAKGLSR